MTEGEVTRIFPTRTEVKEELVDDGLLASPAAEQRDVDIQGQSRLAPAPDGDAADDAETPVVIAAERLNLERRRKDGIHGRCRRSRSRCCSTRPELLHRGRSRGGVARPSRVSTASRACADVIERSSLARTRARATPATRQVATHCLWRSSPSIRLEYSRGSAAPPRFRRQVAIWDAAGLAGLLRPRFGWGE